MNDAVCQNTKIDELNKTIHDFSIREKVYVADIASLKEQVRSLQVQLFGRSSEAKITRDDNQLNLFETPATEPPVIEDPDDVEVITYERKKPGRKPLPEDLPHIDVEHDLSEAEKQCPCGCIKTRIGQEVSKQLEMIPAQMRVIRHVRYKYACKNCEGVEDNGPGVTIARMPEQMIPKSMATPSLLSHILTAKFADALPFYRQEKQFKRLGIDLPRSTMCNWAMKVAQGCDLLMEYMQKEILQSPVIGIDETTLQVLKEPKRSNCYMWVFKGGTPDKPVIMFQYHPTRSGDVAAQFLNGYQGFVQTDGYAGYNFLDTVMGIIHVACWAHSRRKFVAVIKAAGTRKTQSKTGKATTALKYISKLYKIEKQARELDLSSEQLAEKRQKEAIPVLNKFKKWLDTTGEKVPPKSLLGKAINYTLSQWHRLIRYTENGLVNPDNNSVENAIRPFVVGRKNWLFSGTPEGAAASACIYSLIETARVNGLDPYWYLKYLFENLPEAMTADEFKALMPQNVDKDLLATPAT